MKNINDTTNAMHAQAEEGEKLNNAKGIATFIHENCL
jgi:hypothetical protein